MRAPCHVLHGGVCRAAQLGKTRFTRRHVPHTIRRVLIVALFALAIEQARLELAACWPSLIGGAAAWAQQSNLVPQGLDPNTGGYSRNPALPNNQGYGPMGPTGPTSSARPSSWPGGPQDPGRPGATPAPSPPPSGPPLVPKKSPADPPYDPSAILARIGTEVIQATEVLPTMHQTLNSFLQKNPDVFKEVGEEEKKEVLLKWQRDIMERSLSDFIKIKLLLCEVRSKAPADALSKNEEKIRKDFNENQLKEMMATYKAESIIDLENKLRAQGSSLEAQRRVHVERYIAIGWLRQQVKDEPEPTHEQMLTYYKEHLADWETPARTQWEQLTAKFAKFNTKEEAYRTLARWGNDVLRGVPFAEVAKANSHGATADEGGRHDWTSKGSLRSVKLDEAIFQLPEGTLSQIIEDEDGYHIVRVIKREDFRRAPFNEVQPEIKKRLFSGNQEKAMMTYIEKLREHTPVWNRFDDPTGSLSARPQSHPTR
jgi:parvulin-like peptidyl-prolyl isomerase